jgi:hypothetical protein
MKVYGLKATVPLVKSYTLGPAGELQKTSYLSAYNFVSQDFGDNLHLAVRVMAAAGGCLLKGELDRDLDKEPRAGHTSSSQKTRWICLDLDGIMGWNSVDAFLEAIGCAGVDYIVQWSNSAGLSPGLRCHVFMLLDAAATPERLKRWLMHLNLSIPALRAEILLNEIGTALKWPLDVTTCQNDKLIYVAPPILGPGIVDPFAGKDRIELCQRAARTLTLPALVPSEPKLRAQIQGLVAELRAAGGWSPLKVVRGCGEVEYGFALEEAIVTGCRIERGFVYFNLNGGDSWGYYHPVDNPEYIRNFKGEPIYRTAELLPEYWRQIHEEGGTR